MILSVSGRTDVPAFYASWFMNRYKDGFVDVRNPFNENLVSRIYFENVDLIVFCSKNPIPIIKYLKNITHPLLFHITLTPYGKDIEPNVPSKGHIIDAIKQISKIIGKDNVFVRYDPIFINNKYTVDYHVKAFNDLCDKLDGYIKKIIISFMDDYKNVRNNKNEINSRELTKEDYKILGTNFSKIAHNHNIIVHTCFEDENLVEFGVDKDECLSKQLVYIKTGKVYNKKWTARGEGKCNCINMVDIGYYNSCPHLCKYCYANYDEKKVKENFLKHDPDSTLLVGNIKETDVIKVRRK